MKKLVIIRHGRYNRDNGRLNEAGSRQILGLAKRLKAILEGESLLILSSSAPRARDSATVLAEVLGGVIVEIHESLWSDDDGHHLENVPRALALLSATADRADCLLIVTHLEYSESLPESFSRQEQWPNPLCRRKLRKGGAIILDCEQKASTYP